MKNEKNEINTNNFTSTKKQNNMGVYAIVVLLILIILTSSTIGLYAWAKYKSAINGNATAQVAKWYFDLTDIDGTSLATSGPINLAETIDFEHVAKDRIAPGTNGEFQMVIDTTGTEVSLIYDVNISITDCPRNIIFSRVDSDGVETVLSEGEQSGFTRTLNFKRYLQVKPTNENGKHIETIKWNWPYQTGTTEKEKQDNDEIDTLDQGKTVTMNIVATGTHVLEEPKQTSATPVSSLTSADYGQYVNIGTNILGKDNETEADWRIFYKDSTGGVWLILSDYLPVTDGSVGKSTVSGVGLIPSGTYGVNSNISRKDLIDKLNGDWSSLISGSYVAGKEGVEVKGAVDLETWVASWNEKYPNNDTYPTNQIYTAKEDMDDEIGWGYNVSRQNPPSTEDNYVSMSGSEGYKNISEADKLYYPHASISDYNNCYGYWLASPSASNADRVMRVHFDGTVNLGNYNYTFYGVCPAVYLPSSIKLDTSNNELWTMIVNE